MSVYVIGGGGHAKVVISALRAMGRDVVGVLDDNPLKHGTTLLGERVLGTVSDIEPGAEAVIAVGSNQARKRIATGHPTVDWMRVVHPGAVVDPTAYLEPGVVVCAGAVIQPDAYVGAHSIVNTGATVDHDCHLSDYVHVAPGVHLSGGVRLEEGAFVGIGACVVPGVRIGAWVTVGAGAAVIRNLPAGVTAVGVPASHCPRL